MSEAIAIDKTWLVDAFVERYGEHFTKDGLELCDFFKETLLSKKGDASFVNTISRDELVQVLTNAKVLIDNIMIEIREKAPLSQGKPDPMFINAWQGWYRHNFTGLNNLISYVNQESLSHTQAIPAFTSRGIGY